MDSLAETAGRRTELVNTTAFVPDISALELLPLLVLLAGAIGCLILDSFVRRESSRRFLPLVTVSTLVATFGCLYADLFPRAPFVEGAFLGGDFGVLGALTITLSGILIAILSPSFIERRDIPAGEFYSLLLFAIFGMVALTIANELITAYVVLEIASISLYVLVGLDRRSPRGIEAAFKYFMLGAFASAFMVMGIAFLYGATGVTRMDEIAAILSAGSKVVVGEMTDVQPIFVMMGFGFLLAGLCFKLSLAPFHMYAPDVYEGANTPATMFLTTASKVASFAFLVHIIQMMGSWGPFPTIGVYLLGFVAAASILWGNLGAIAQSNLKRMLAYSSVAHTGYVTIGLVVIAALPGMFAGDELAAQQAAMRQAIIFYLGGYALMNLLAFGIAHYIGGEGPISAWRGLVYRKPLAAFGMALALFSLLGLPPTVGFMGKFYVFSLAVEHGFIGLVVLGVLGTAISAVYYLGMIATMFMREETEDGVTLAGMDASVVRMVSGENAARVFLVAAAGLVIVFGILPTLFFSLQATG